MAVADPNGIERWVASMVAAFRTEAGCLKRYGAAEAAQALTQAAADLEAGFQRYWFEALPVAEAAAESGYSVERMRELVREGKVARADNVRRVRIRRRDLPRKAPAAAALGRIADRLGIR